MDGYEIDGSRAGQARCALRDGAGEQRFSQAGAARELGVHPVTLNRIENGKARASLDLVERMADLYGVSRNWLLGLPEEVDPVERERELIAAGLIQIRSCLEELDTIADALRDRAAALVPGRTATA